VGELQRGGPVAVDRTGGDVLNHLERSEAVEAVKHGGELGVVGALFDIEEDDVFDGGGGSGGGDGRHSDLGGGEKAAEGSQMGGDCWSVRLKQWASPDSEGDHPGCVRCHCENGLRGCKRLCSSG